MADQPENSSIAGVKQPFRVYGGDTWTRRLKFWNGPASANDPIDISQYVFKMQIKQQATGDVALELTIGNGFTITPDANNNILDIEKDIKLTGKNYVYDLQITFPDATIQTYLYGPFIVVQDVTDTDQEQ